MLGPQVSPQEIMSRKMELGCESWTSFLLPVVTQQRLLLNSGAMDIVLVTAQHSS